VATKAIAERTSAALAVGVMEIPLLIPARARAISFSSPTRHKPAAREAGGARIACTVAAAPAGWWPVGVAANPHRSSDRYTDADHCVQPKYPVHTVVRVQLKAMQITSETFSQKKITSETNGTPWSSAVISRAICMAQEPCGGEWWLDR